MGEQRLYGGEGTHRLHLVLRRLGFFNFDLTWHKVALNESQVCVRGVFCYQILFLLRQIVLIYEYVWVVHCRHTVSCGSQKRALNSLQPDLQAVLSCLYGCWEPNLSPSEAIYAHWHWAPLWDFWSAHVCLRFGSFHIWDKILLCCDKLFPVPFFFSAFWSSRHQALLTFTTIQDLWSLDIVILHCGHHFSSVGIMSTFICQPYKITWETVSMHFQIFMEKQNNSSSGFLMNTTVDFWQKGLRVGQLPHSTKSPVTCGDLSSHEGTLGIEPRVWTPGWCSSSCRCVFYGRENLWTLIQNFKVDFYLSKGRRVQPLSVFSLCSKYMLISCACTRVCICGHVCRGSHVEVKGQLWHVVSLLQPFLSCYLPGYLSLFSY